MSIQSLLAMKTNNGTTAAYRLIGATAAQIGPAFGTAETLPANSTQQRPTNRIVQFSQGSSPEVLLVAWVSNGIFTYNGVTWTQRFTLSPALPAANEFAHTGLYIANVSGVPTLIGLYRGADNIAHGISSPDGVIWTASPSLGGLAFTQVFATCVFNNVLYLSTDIFYGHFSWDPSTNAVTSSNGPAGLSGATFGGKDYCVFNNALYFLAESSSAPSGYWLWALNSGSWVQVVQLLNPGNSAPIAAAGSTPFGSDTPRPLLFDGGDGFLYAFYLSFKDVGHYGYDACKLTVAGLSGTTADISSAVLPAAWLYGQQPGSINFDALIETDSQPGNPVTPTTIASGSNGQSLPQGTIFVASTTGFPSTGTLLVTTSGGPQIVTYTSVTGGGTPSFNGCVGGTGSMTTGGSVVLTATPTIHIFMATNYVNAPWNYFPWNGPSTPIGNGGLPVDSGGDVSMTLSSVKDGGSERVWVPSDFDVRILSVAPLSNAQRITFQAFGPVGNESKSYVQQFSLNDLIPGINSTLSSPGVVNTTIAAGSNAQSLPQTTVNVISTAGFPTPTVNFSTTVASGSNAVNVNTFVGAGTLFVATTTGFPTSGTAYVQTAASGLAVITYTSITGGGTPSLNGCTTLGGYSGVLSTGGTVQLSTFPGTLLVATNANSTTIASGSNAQSLPQSQVFVASTAGFPSSGYILVQTSAGLQCVTYTSIAGGGTPSFNGCSGGTGTMTTGGTVTSLQVVNYLTVAATSFGGCSTVSGTGAMATGGTVLSGPSTPPTLDANGHQLDGVTCDGNTVIPTTFIYTWNSGSEPAPGPVTNNQRVRIAPRIF